MSIHHKMLMSSVAMLWGPNAPMALKVVYDRLAAVEFDGYMRGFRDSARGHVADRAGLELIIEEETPAGTKLN